MTLNVNDLPTRGNVTITPREGVARTTTFTFDLAGFQDLDAPGDAGCSRTALPHGAVLLTLTPFASHLLAVLCASAVRRPGSCEATMTLLSSVACAHDLCFSRRIQVTLASGTFTSIGDLVFPVPGAVTANYTLTVGVTAHDIYAGDVVVLSTVRVTPAVDVSLAARSAFLQAQTQLAASLSSVYYTDRELAVATGQMVSGLTVLTDGSGGDLQTLMLGERVTTIYDYSVHCMTHHHVCACSADPLNQVAVSGCVELVGRVVAAVDLTVNPSTAAGLTAAVAKATTLRRRVLAAELPNPLYS